MQVYSKQYYRIAIGKRYFDLTIVDLEKNNLKITMLPKYSQTDGFIDYDGNLRYEYGTIYRIGVQINSEIFVDVCKPGRTKTEAIINLCQSLSDDIDSVPFDRIDIGGFNKEVYKEIAYHGC